MKRPLIKTRNVFGLIATLCVSLCCVVLPLEADPLPSASSWYYDMGGSSSYGSFSERQPKDFGLGVDPRWNLGNACAFNPQVSIHHSISDAKRSLYSLKAAVLSSATAMISSSAMDVIQRANPGLYDLLTKNLAQAMAKYEVAVKNCRAIQNDLGAGESPLDDWITLSNKSRWSKASAAGDQDPVEIEQDIDENPGDEGVTWVNGEQAGGAGQAPIKMVEDTIKVGYGHWRDDDSRLGKVFADEAAAVAYAHKVLGETTLRTCQNCQRLITRVALGIKGEHSKEREYVREALRQLVSLPSLEDVTDEAIENVSAPGMGIILTPDVIAGLRIESASDQVILLNRLADEIALQRQVEKMLIIRHLLKAARQDPNVAINGPALKHIDRYLTLIQQDLDEILWERKVRQEVASSTASVIAGRYQTYTRKSQGEGVDLRAKAQPLHQENRE